MAPNAMDPARANQWCSWYTGTAGAEVAQQARDALAQGVVRRWEMLGAVVGITITIGLLVLMKRELDRGWAESQEPVR